MKDKTFYFLVFIVAVIIIIIAVVIIRGNKSSVINNNSQVNTNTGNNTNNISTGNNMPSTPSIHGKSIFAKPTSGNTVTLYKESPFVVFTTVSNGDYIGVADKYDSNTSYIRFLELSTNTYMLVQSSQVRVS